MSRSLYENHWGSPTLTLLNVLGVLGVLNVLNVLHVLHVVNMPMDTLLACWALFLSLTPKEGEERSLSALFLPPGRVTKESQDG